MDKQELLNLHKHGFSRMFLCLMYNLSPRELSEIIGPPKPRRGRYPQDVRQAAIALFEGGDKSDGPRATYMDIADFYNGYPCASTICRWVREDRFLREQKEVK